MLQRDQPATRIGARLPVWPTQLTNKTGRCDETAIAYGWFLADAF
jgi:4'-phosphopantetheinyl transferase EntD